MFEYDTVNRWHGQTAQGETVNDEPRTIANPVQDELKRCERKHGGAWLRPTVTTIDFDLSNSL